MQFKINTEFQNSLKTPTDNFISKFCYKVDNLYSKECDRSIRFDDSEIGIDWGEVFEEFLSDKDLQAPKLADSDCNFAYMS